MTRPKRCAIEGCGRIGAWYLASGFWVCDQHYAEKADCAEKPSNRNVPSTAPKRRRGVMNATERAWAAELEGDPFVERYRFEEVTFTVGAGEHGKRPKRYTPDFFVVLLGWQHGNGPSVEIHEVKGQHRHRRRGVETLKAAAKQYPEFRWFLVERDGDSWKKTPII